MNSRVSKASTRRSRKKASNIAQQKLRDGVASTGAGAELPPGHREQSLQSEDLAGDTAPVQARKRRLQATSEGNLSPAKRARSTRTDILQPGAEDRKVAQAAKTTREAPKPKPPKRRDTSLPAPKVEGQEQATPATRLRKRQIDGDGDDSDNEARILNRGWLTRSSLDNHTSSIGSNVWDRTKNERNQVQHVQYIAISPRSALARCQDPGCGPCRYCSPDVVALDVVFPEQFPSGCGLEPGSGCDVVLGWVPGSGSPGKRLTEEKRTYKWFENALVSKLKVTGW